MRPFPSLCIACTDNWFIENAHAGVMLEAGVFFFLFCFVFFCFLLLIDFFSISKFSDAEFTSLTSKKPAYCFLLKADKCTLSLGEITVCASKQLFLLVTKKKTKKKKVPAILSRKPCEESDRTAQMHPWRRYTIWDCSSISYIFHCSCMMKARARYGSTCS